MGSGSYVIRNDLIPLPERSADLIDYLAEKAVADNHGYVQSPGGLWVPMAGDADGQVKVVVDATSGGATATNQSTEITRLANIDGKVPALGQALAASSVPVVLTALQQTALTPPAAITGFATATLQGTGNTSLASIDGKTPALNTSGAAPVTQTPAASGGLLIYRNIDTGITGAVIKASAGQLYGYYIANLGTATRFVKLYNKASAPSSADTPVLTFPLPAGAAANVSHPNGVEFTTGMSIRASTAVADNDNTAPTANDVIANVYYK